METVLEAVKVTMKSTTKVGMSMKRTIAAIVVWCGAVTVAIASPGPTPTVAAPTASAAPIAAPKDVVYPGEIHLAVDATDVDRRIVRIHETLSGINGDTV